MTPTKIDYLLDLPDFDEPMEVIINVTYFHETKPNRDSWDSDLDYNGYYETDFDILLADGTPAPELYKKLSKNAKWDIEITIHEAMTECN